MTAGKSAPVWSTIGTGSGIVNTRKTMWEALTRFGIGRLGPKSTDSGGKSSCRGNSKGQVELGIEELRFDWLVSKSRRFGSLPLVRRCDLTGSGSGAHYGYRARLTDLSAVYQ